MQLSRRSRGAPYVAAVLLLGALVSCRPEQAAVVRPDRDRAVVVASFSFPESELLAEIYAQALADAGIPARLERGLGSRELVLPAVQQGFVDVVPEYLGTALASARPGRTPDAAVVHDTAAARRSLEAALKPWRLHTLRPSAASDQNGLVVTRATARRLGLRKTSDLARRADRLTFAATPECAERAYCLPGLRRVYGLHFRRVVTYQTEAARAAALEEGSADVALLFTTYGRLASDRLVLLRDDRGLQPVENVLPLVSRRAMTRYGPRLQQTLDRVSAALTTGGLRFLSWRVELDGRAIRAEARGWLRRHALVTPRR